MRDSFGVLRSTATARAHERRSESRNENRRSGRSDESLCFDGLISLRIRNRVADYRRSDPHRCWAEWRKPTIDLLSLVAVQPFRGGSADVASSVGCAGGNEQLFADLKKIFSLIHLEFFFAFEFVTVVDEVVPDPSRRVDPQVAGKSPCGPALPNFCFIH